MLTLTREERAGGRARRMATTACWLAVAPAATWAALRLAGLERGPVVQAVAFTPYVAAGSLAPVVLALALRRRAPAIVAAVTALTLIGVVAPRAVASGQPTVDGPTLRLLTANVMIGGADPAGLVDLVRAQRVDVLTLQEFTPDIAVELNRLGLAELLPYQQLAAIPGAQGSALWSRHPLSAAGTRVNAGGFRQAYATVAVPGAAPLPVESAHPMSPYQLSVLGWWRTDLRAQPPATPDGPPRILAGDFNATLDHAPLRALLATGYVDAGDAAGAGLAGTWGPYDGDPIPPVTIDHVLVDRRIAVDAVTIYPLRGSDHRAVLAELRLPAAP